MYGDMPSKCHRAHV